MDTSFYEYFINNKDTWFNKSHKYDTHVKKHFRHILDYSFLANNKPEIDENNMDDIINYIIICDQLPYYVFRNEQKHITKYHMMALSVATKVFNNDIFYKFNDVQQCFIMMPLRHTNLFNNYSDIIKKIDTLEQTPIIERFRKATLLRYSVMKNRLHTDIITEQVDINMAIIDKSSTYNDSIPLLSLRKNDPFLNKINFKLKPSEPLSVSLSGGVDSMVILYILHHMNYNVSAIHINYKNRTTSDDEMNLCINFCNKLGIPIYIREIDELQRTRDKDRESYEYITHEIRFNFYNLISNNIVLGHNMDDMVENIFSNIAKNKNHDNLFGMEESHYDNHGVTIHRPMLNITKDEIYQFAHDYGIPYTYDSTPEWSERGKKRDILMPFINNFDKRIIPGLVNVVKHFNMKEKFYKSSIKKLFTTIPFVKDEVTTVVIAKLSEEIKDYDETVWFDVINLICKTHRIPYISVKAINTLYRCQHMKVVLNKYMFYEKYNIYWKN